MNKILYMLLVAAIMTACSNGEQKSDKNTGISVNPSMISVAQIVGVGKVEPEKEIISLSAITGGVVREIYRNDGDTIRKGGPVVRLDDELEVIKVAQLKSQYLAQKAQKEIDELAFRDSESKLANKRKLLESVRILAGKGAETLQSLDDMETEVTSLSLETDKKRAAVVLSDNRLKELAAQLRYAEAEASRKILRSPYDGILLELHVKEGSAVSQYESYAEVAPEGFKIVTAEIDELFASRLKNGLDAEIRFIGSDSIAAKGKVIFLSPYLKKKSLFSEKASEQEDRLVREVKVKLEENNNLLLNSKVECLIRIK